MELKLYRVTRKPGAPAIRGGFAWREGITETRDTCWRKFRAKRNARVGHKKKKTAALSGKYLKKIVSRQEVNHVTKAKTHRFR